MVFTTLLFFTKENKINTCGMVNFIIGFIVLLLIEFSCIGFLAGSFFSPVLGFIFMAMLIIGFLFMCCFFFVPLIFAFILKRPGYVESKCGENYECPYTNKRALNVCTVCKTKVNDSAFYLRKLFIMVISANYGNVAMTTTTSAASGGLDMCPSCALVKHIFHWERLLWLITHGVAFLVCLAALIFCFIGEFVWKETLEDYMKFGMILLPVNALLFLLFHLVLDYSGVFLILLFQVVKGFFNVMGGKVKKLNDLSENIKEGAVKNENSDLNMGNPVNPEEVNTVPGIVPVGSGSLMCQAKFRKDSFQKTREMPGQLFRKKPNQM